MPRGLPRGSLLRVIAKECALRTFIPCAREDSEGAISYSGVVVREADFTSFPDASL